MARVQLIIPDDDRERFAHQARREGMTLSVWFCAAANERLAARGPVRRKAGRLRTREDFERFFKECDARRGPGVEPDWEEHLQTMDEDIRRGMPDL